MVKILLDFLIKSLFKNLNWYKKGLLTKTDRCIIIMYNAYVCAY